MHLVVGLEQSQPEVSDINLWVYLFDSIYDVFWVKLSADTVGNTAGKWVL